MDQSVHVTKLHIYAFMKNNFYFTKYLSENLGNATKGNKARLLTSF